METAKTINGVSLTALECTLLQAVTTDRSFWAETEDIRNGEWAFSIYDEMQALGVNAFSTGGIVASLVKKGVIRVITGDTHEMIAFTDLGFDIMLEIYPDYVKEHSGR